MNENLKILDAFDKTTNLYKLIAETSERAHSILNGALPIVEGNQNDIPAIVMLEVLSELKKHE